MGNRTAIAMESGKWRGLFVEPPDATTLHRKSCGSRTSGRMKLASLRIRRTLSYRRLGTVGSVKG
ncbi:hypothetical protein [Cohnella algarum]|uniref:hypothetical protein n=1 Tax=Cohnella algarum TaxID=2044859 RepID=UPI001966D2B7|nr:hypothetical protein [Cohnella algarum]MBN2982397.1 hypothetical protein [Cohnella algarum]